jgi:hypothetical protein
MSRAAIVATIVTSILAFSLPSLAVSDEEVGHSGDKMSAAFRCLTYARMFHDYKEEQRLFQIGLKAGRDFYEGMKSRDDATMGETMAFMRSVSTDFMVGVTYDRETTKAYDGIVKYDDGIPRERWLTPDVAKSLAERSYRNSNCSLIN